MVDPILVHRISPWRRAAFLAPWVLLAFPLLLAGLLAALPGLLWTGVLVTAIWSPLAYLVCWRTRLVVTPRGVTLHQLGMHLETTWENVAAVDLTPRRQGLVLHAPLEGRGAARLAAAAVVRLANPGTAIGAYLGGRPELVAERRFIPLEPFGHAFARGDLAGAIARFAPHVTPAAPGVPPATSAPLGRRRVLAIALLIGASAALGIALGTDWLPADTTRAIHRAIAGVVAAVLALHALLQATNVVRRLRARRWNDALGAFVLFLLTLGGAFLLLGAALPS